MLPRPHVVVSLSLSLLIGPFPSGRTGAATTSRGAPVQGSGVNVALPSNGATLSASSTLSSNYPLSAVNNGDRKGLNWGAGGGWADATPSGPNQFPDWVQIDFPTSQAISEIDVFTVQDNWSNPSAPTLTMTFTQWGITYFNVQYWDGANWVSVPGGSVTGNNKVWRQFTFSAIVTPKIRVYITSCLSGNSRLTEIEAWTPTQTPSASITSPANGAIFAAIANITISATASDSDGTITKVEFYQGSTKVGESTTSPYSCTWSGVGVGSYALTAKAIDNSGTTKLSSPVNISVTFQPATIAGRVTRTDGITAIAGAAIKVLQGVSVSGSAISNSTGDYSVTGLWAGTYSVEASVAGYSTQRQDGVVTTSAQTTTLNFSLDVPINYVYDELGRLVGVVDQNGDGATYAYDAVGNLLSISRQSASQASLIGFSPASGVVGTTVTIYGTGFSSTASQNTVTFNGVAATVASSSPSVIVTNVPTNATTGPIAITSPSGSATSSNSFNVTVVAPSAPTITGFNPTTGLAGTTVTITGTGFETTPANDKVSLNISQALVSSAAPTSISTSVPSGTLSGRISVATPLGKAVSTADFIVPPSPYVPADVQFAGRISTGGTNTLTISTANKIGLMLFDGVANQRVSLSYSNNTIPEGLLNILSPQGTVLSSRTGAFTSSGFVEPISLPITGTYTILVYPTGATVGSMPMTLYGVPPDVTGSISVGGPSVPVSITIPGQNASLSFSGTAGQKVSVSTSNSTIGAFTVSIKKPDGTTLASSGWFIDIQVLPTTGTYSVTLDPGGAYTGSVTLKLNDCTEVTGTLTIGGSPLTVNITSPGQGAVLSFSGTAGQQVTVHVTDNGPWCDTTVRLLRPDGTTMTSSTSCFNSFNLATQTLPTTGTYTITIDPSTTNTGDITVSVSSP